MAEAVTESAALLSDKDRGLLTLAQHRVPIVPRPFLRLGECVGLAEADVIGRLRALKEAGIIRKIGPVFEPAALELASELLAARVLPDRLDAIGAEVARWPEVTHCYAREHDINLWFAGIAPTQEWFAAAGEQVAAMDGVQGVWRLPTLRRFKIGVVFELAPVERYPDSRTSNIGRRPSPVLPLLDSSALLKTIQSDLPLCSRPFQALAAPGGVTEDELVETIAALLESGAVRRYGALVSHRRLGIAANAMVVMAVPEDAIEAAGVRVAECRSVSHCYQRPAFEGFPYNLYAMVHGADRASCLDVTERLADSAGASDWQALFSTREYGKSAPDYARLVAAKGGAAWR